MRKADRSSAGAGQPVCRGTASENSDLILWDPPMAKAEGAASSENWVTGLVSEKLLLDKVTLASQMSSFLSSRFQWNHLVMNG